MVTEVTQVSGITVADVKRALLNGGNLKSIGSVIASAWGDPPLTGLDSIVRPVALPTATALLEPLNDGLAGLVRQWISGKKSHLEETGDTEVILAGAPARGRGVGSHLAELIKEVGPDVVAIDAAPSTLSAAMMYAFGLPAACGLPLHGEVRDRKSGRFYFSGTHYPGDARQTAILECWRNRLPLIPAGIPEKPEKTMMDISAEEMLLPRDTEVFTVFDNLLIEASALNQSSLELNRLVCGRISNWLKSDISSQQVKEAGYAASRIMDLAAALSASGRKILFIVDIKQYESVRYALELLQQGISDEVYFQPRKDHPASVLFSRYAASLTEEGKGLMPEKSAFQAAFEQALENFSRSRENAELSEEETDRLVAAIADRTRHHPEISRGASVRGSIACKELLHGYAALQGGITRSGLQKAARLAFGPRIVTVKEDEESADAILEDIINEVLFGISFTPSTDWGSLMDEMSWMSPEEMLQALENMEAGQPGMKAPNDKSGDKNMAVSDPLNSASGMPDFSKEQMLQPGKNQAGSMSNTIQMLLDMLDEKLAAGEISREEYAREKQKLESMRSAADYLASPESGQEMAKTVFELMDAQDKHWGKKLNFEDIHVYYHIKGTSEKSEISPPKQGYHRLRVLVDTMEKGGLIKEAAKEKTFSLTAEALDLLMDLLLPKKKRGRELADVLAGGQTAPGEVKYDIQRYSPGNVFRDISVRHTLRQIARNQRKPEEIQRRDLRVYIRKPRNVQSDIVICLDTSGSMGFRHKLTYARLAAASLAESAVSRGDRVGIIDFDDLGEALAPLSKNRNEIMSSIAGITAGGNTNIGDGIKTASTMLLRSPGQNDKHIVLVTDGLPSAVSRDAFDRMEQDKERDLTEDYAILETKIAAARGIRTSVIHIVDENDEGRDFIESLARNGNGEISRVTKPADLRLTVV